ncbi:MAG: diacylglycerol kinase [Christensenella sp.]|nr:diacylglycerol kinase [Christensenella sp.]
MENKEPGKKYRPKKSLISSFNHAINGFLQSFKMERNMKIHVALAALVIVAALVTQVTRFEMMMLILSIAFVFFAELFNTAIEAAVDIASHGEYNELARIAKDVAAGAVLVAAMNALVIGYLVFYRKLYTFSYLSVSYVENLPGYITFAALILVFIAVIVMKSRSMKKGGNYVQGGMPSGHTAFAFALFTAIVFVSGNAVASTFAAVLALIVAESRMETKVHTFAEVLVGALMGIVITVLVFQVGEAFVV